MCIHIYFLFIVLNFTCTGEPLDKYRVKPLKRFQYMAGVSSIKAPRFLKIYCGPQFKKYWHTGAKPCILFNFGPFKLKCKCLNYAHSHPGLPFLGLPFSLRLHFRTPVASSASQKEEEEGAPCFLKTSVSLLMLSGYTVRISLCTTEKYH